MSTRLTAEALQTFLNEHEGFFIAENKVQLYQEQEDEEIGLSINLLHKERSVSIDLICEYPDASSLVALAGIRTLDDLHKISNATLWKQYLSGKGFACATLYYWNNFEMNFRIRKEVTEVYSKDFHYFDEIDQLLSQPERLMQYINEHWPHRTFVELNIKE